MGDFPAFPAGPLASLFALGAAAAAPATPAAPATMPSGASPVPVIPGGVAAGPIVSPVLILVLCVIAGLGTFVLLPSKLERAKRNLGGVILLVASLILLATLIRTVAGLGQGGISVYFWLFSGVTLLCAIRVVTHARAVYAALYFVLSVLATAGLFVLLWAEFMAAALIIIYAGAILVTYVFVIMLAAQSRTAWGGVRPAEGDADPIPEYDRISREPLVASCLGFTVMGVLLFVIFDKSPSGPLDRFAIAEATTKPAAVVAPVAPPVVLPAAATQPVVSAVPAEPPVPVYHPGSPQRLGVYLFKTQIVNLEMAGVILTIAMVGAILIARRRVMVATPAEPSAAAAGAAGAAGARSPKVPGGAYVDDNPHLLPIQGTDNPRAKAYPET